MTESAADMPLMQSLRSVADLTADAGVQRIADALRQRCDTGVTAWLVGGAVRDLLVGVVPREYDVAIAGDAIGVARAVVAGGGSLVAVHESFGTADIVLDDHASGGIRMDLAMLRSEVYSSPGALPDVTPVNNIHRDVLRRDVTINALAWQISPQFGTSVIDAVGGLDDLQARTIRVLHDESFIDDPTRLFRCARYAARFGTVDTHTGELARAAVRTGALKTISPARVVHELNLVMSEPDGSAVRAAMQYLREWGVLSVVLPNEARTDIAVPGWHGAADMDSGGGAAADALRWARWASLYVGVDRSVIREWCTRAGMPAADVRMIAALAAVQQRYEAQSPVRELLAVDRDVVTAINTAWGPSVAAGWCALWDQAREFITGHDLHQLGLIDGPHVGAILARVRDRIYDGDITSRSAALNAARGLVQQHLEGG